MGPLSRKRDLSGFVQISLGSRRETVLCVPVALGPTARHWGRESWRRGEGERPSPRKPDVLDVPTGEPNAEGKRIFPGLAGA